MFFPPIYLELPGRPSSLALYFFLICFSVSDCISCYIILIYFPTLAIAICSGTKLEYCLNQTLLCKRALDMNLDISWMTPLVSFEPRLRLILWQLRRETDHKTQFLIRSSGNISNLCGQRTGRHSNTAPQET